MCVYVFVWSHILSCHVNSYDNIHRTTHMLCVAGKIDWPSRFSIIINQWLLATFSRNEHVASWFAQNHLSHLELKSKYSSEHILHISLPCHVNSVTRWVPSTARFFYFLSKVRVFFDMLKEEVEGFLALRGRDLAKNTEQMRGSRACWRGVYLTYSPDRHCTEGGQCDCSLYALYVPRRRGVNA